MLKQKDKTIEGMNNHLKKKSVTCLEYGQSFKQSFEGISKGLICA